MPRHLPPALLAVLVLTLAGGAWGQDALQPLRDLIDRGYWHSAAQLTGPALVAQLPDDPEAHFLYATALYLTGDVGAAAARLELATSLVTGGVPASHVHLAALIRADQGDPAGAARQLQNAFLREPDYRYAMDWGRIAWQAGLLTEAEAAFRAAAATPEGAREVWPHVAHGRLFTAQGRLEEAVAAYLTALDVYEAHDPGGPRPPGPGYVEAWYRLGEAYEAQGRLREAEAAYRAARSVDPNHGPSVQAVDRLARRGE
ncbi:MAG: tetratricopeptide repeat protein [Trueperaceae bacterium]|nr:tetratricopeptide repeat protein [Trueperaceae bacterium]